MARLVSIDLKADFGFFRKPETNDGINLSYNMLHKPALLGILGAIIGLKGYEKKGEFPEYYQKLKDLRVGIAPVGHEQGNFGKTVIKYSNTVGYANKGTTYLTEEATLLKPGYRCYLLLEDDNEYHQKLYEYLSQGKAEFIPYFGKNECQATWDVTDGAFAEYDFAESIPSEAFKINSLFSKKDFSVKEQVYDDSEEFDLLDLNMEDEGFLFFERLPIGFDQVLRQYILGKFAFTTYKLRPKKAFPNLYFLKDTNTHVQLA